MNKTKISWCDYTWNPVVGCRRGCYYCYAKKLNDRFKFIDDFSQPQYFPGRLRYPFKVKKPSTIFVGSMCDLWDSGLDIKILWHILDTCWANPHHTFMFLTKNPVGYNGFDFPKNCILGLTLVKPSKKYDIFVDYGSGSGRKYLSIEPILSGGFDKLDLSFMELIIIGAMTGVKPVIPKKEWINSISHRYIHYKQSAFKYL